MQEFWGRFFQRGIKINVGWIIGLIFVGWVVTAFYITVTEALETAEARVYLTSALHERDQQLELREELKAKARALGIESSTASGEVLAPSREAYLKEFWRMQRLVRPGESISSYPLAPESFPPRFEPSPPSENPFSSPLEAWKALLGFIRSPEP
ncbi:MAG: hypothetical protein RMK30_07180 [Anaerolineae bacterium]|nr:hypothetical protein [Anaerolineae bacterium]MDW8102641.1 hypothetical protein [Anaerolineae bacterium]